MENRIPTAEEFLQNKLTENSYSWTDVPDLMIEFTKLHVEAALKSAGENVQLETYYDPVEECPYESVVDSSILNAYPEENIK